MQAQGTLDLSPDPGALPTATLADLSGGGRRSRIAAVRRGLPVMGVVRLLDAGRMTLNEIERRVLPRDVLPERARSGRLSPDDSDRLSRGVRTMAAAEETFGSIERAATWLRRPSDLLDGEAPLALLDTGEGMRDVEALLGRIAHRLGARRSSGGPAERPTPICPAKARVASAVAGTLPAGPWSPRPSRRRSRPWTSGCTSSLPFDLLPLDDVLIGIETGCATVERVAAMPSDPATSGDAWLMEGRSALPGVPSAIIPESADVLIGPEHPEPAAIRIVSRRPFGFDRRLRLSA